MLTQVGEHNFDKSSESSTTGKPVWQKLWKIWIPSWVSIFLWKMLQLALPVKSELARRQINTNLNCDVWRSPRIISQNHLFMHCNFARAMWFGTSIGARTDLINSINLVQWLTSSVEACSSSKPKRPRNNDRASNSMDNLENKEYGHLWTKRTKYTPSHSEVQQINKFRNFANCKEWQVLIALEILKSLKRGSFSWPVKDKTITTLLSPNY